MSFKKKIKGLGAIVLAGSLVLNTGIFAGDIFSSGDQGFEPAATQNEDALPFVGSAEDQQADVFAAISSGVSGTEQVENGSDEVSLFASADFSQPSETDFVKSYLFVEKDTPAYLDANGFSEVGKFPENVSYMPLKRLLLRLTEKHGLRSYMTPRMEENQSRLFRSALFRRKKLPPFLNWMQLSCRRS